MRKLIQDLDKKVSKVKGKVRDLEEKFKITEEKKNSFKDPNRNPESKHSINQKVNGNYQ